MFSPSSLFVVNGVASSIKGMGHSFQFNCPNVNCPLAIVLPGNVPGFITVPEIPFLKFCSVM